MSTLVESVVIKAPIKRCFDLVRSVELHEDSSTLIDGQAVGGKQSGLSALGDETVWSARFFGLRFRLRTRIMAMDIPASFHEEMVEGLLASFGHTYTCEATPDGQTLLTDRFTFTLPFGWLGRLVARWFLQKRMTQVQTHRLQAIKEVAESERWRQYLENTSQRAV